jgi:hypothetical protein
VRSSQLRSAPRVVAAALTVLLVPLGLGTKRYHGPGEAWVHGYAGDILFASFWVFGWKTAKPDAPATRVALLVFAACCLVEFTQLIHTPGLDRFRRTFLGHLLLGSGFEFADLAYYAMGAALAVGMMMAIESRVPTG